jgi:alpha-1,2-mannosyltransferase
MDALPAHSAFYGHLAATAIALLAIWRLTANGRTSRSLTALLGAGCLALAAVGYLFSDPHHMFSDFWQAYYRAGRAVALEGPGGLLPFLDHGVEGFVNLPIVAYLFAPFGLLPEFAATVLFNLLGLGLTALAWLLLVQIAKLDLTGRWMLAALFAANGPLIYSIKIANTTQAVLCALAAALLLLRAKRPLWAGALLGLAALIKLPLLVFGPFLLLRRDLRGTAAFSLVLGAAGALSVLAFGLQANLHWVDVAVLRFSREWLPAYNNQSVPGLVGRLHTGTTYLRDWLSTYTPPAGERLAVQLTTLVLFLLAAAAGLRSRTTVTDESSRLDLQYALTVALALLFSPISWSHYYLLLLLPTALFLGGAQGLGRTPLGRGLTWTAIFLVTPIVRFSTFSDGGWLAGYQGVGLSYLLIGGLLWFILLTWRLLDPEALLRHGPAPRHFAALEATK